MSRLNFALALLVCDSARWSEHYIGRLKGHLLFLRVRFTLVRYSVMVSAKTLSVRKERLTKYEIM